ncbi:MAG TPA: cytochrome c [Candidatus Acidoferrales bacterium]|nr:cytochrome c [Candidatus Acidoferrales bacterium]
MQSLMLLCTDCEDTMSFRWSGFRYAGLPLILLAASVPVMAAPQARAKPPSNSPDMANPKDGATIFKQDCAVCHGVSAHGDGPAAKDLKAQPPDLTKLAKRRGGTFPNGYVLDVLRNGVQAPAHGTVEMPVWGPMFDMMNHDNAAQSKLRIISVVNYLKSIQEK